MYCISQRHHCSTIDAYGCWEREREKETAFEIQFSNLNQPNAQLNIYRRNVSDEWFVHVQLHTLCTHAYTHIQTRKQMNVMNNNIKQMNLKSQLLWEKIKYYFILKKMKRIAYCRNRNHVCVHMMMMFFFVFIFAFSRINTFDRAHCLKLFTPLVIYLFRFVPCSNESGKKSNHRISYDT